MKLLRRFLEWLLSFFYKDEPIKFEQRKAKDEWEALIDARAKYYRHGSSYLYRLRRYQATRGYYSINNFAGLKQ